MNIKLDNLRLYKIQAMNGYQRAGIKTNKDKNGKSYFMNAFYRGEKTLTDLIFNVKAYLSQSDYNGRTITSINIIDFDTKTTTANNKKDDELADWDF